MSYEQELILHVFHDVNSTFYPIMKRIADKYANLCGYRQHGLKYDDLLCEENPIVQKVRSADYTLFILPSACLTLA